MTFVDGKRHRNFYSFEIENDQSDIMATATLKCAYESQLQGYWEPIIHAVGIHGGFYNDDLNTDIGWLFLGRVRGVEREGDELKISLQDLGWKFKQTCPQDFYKSSVLGKNAKSAFYYICKYLGLKYLALDQNKIFDNLVFTDEGELKYGGESEVKEIPNYKEQMPAISGTKNSIGSGSDVNNQKTLDFIEGIFLKKASKVYHDEVGAIEYYKNEINLKNATYAPNFETRLKRTPKIQVTTNKNITRADIKQAMTKTKITKDVVTGSGTNSCSRNSCVPYGTWPTKSWVNKCTHPRCGKTGTLSDTPKDPTRRLTGAYNVPEGEWTCDTKKGGCGADYCMACGYEKITGSKIHLEPAKTSTTSAADTDNYTKGTEIAAGEKTFEDIVETICKAGDALIIIYNDQALLITFPRLMELSSYFEKNYGDKVIDKIDFWRMEDESFNLDVSQHGFYNTVHVKYKKGTVTASYDNLVKVFDEVAITYSHPQDNKSSAQVKADAYLAAHVRDFGLKVELNVLGSKRHFAGNFIRVKDPKNFNADEKYFIQSVNISGSDDQVITSSLDLRYGPENPDNPDIPEIGLQKDQTVSIGGSPTGTKGLANNSGNTDDCPLTADVVNKAKELTKDAKTKTEKATIICKWVTDRKNCPYSSTTDRGLTKCPTKCLNGTPCNCMSQARLVIHMCKALGIESKLSENENCGIYRHNNAKIKVDGKWKTCDPTCSSLNPKW